MVRVTTISQEEILGDLLAPEGSKLWCVGMRSEIQRLLDQHQTDHEALRRCLDAFIQRQGWLTLGFISYTAFCLARPREGLGRSQDDIDRIISEGKAKKAKELAADPEVMPINANGGDRKTEEGTSVLHGNTESRGNDASYLVRRLKRDAPEIAEALGRGEYPSARAAGIAAGIVRVPTPLEIVRKNLPRLTPEERQRLRQDLDALDATP